MKFFKKKKRFFHNSYQFNKLLVHIMGSRKDSVLFFFQK